MRSDTPLSGSSNCNSVRLPAERDIGIMKKRQVSLNGVPGKALPTLAFSLHIHGIGRSTMDAGVRKALTSLKALLDEGFITKAEFGTRRQVIIDQATAVQPVAAPQTSADSTGITGLARSVFDRLGEAPQKRGGVFDRLGLPKPAGSIRKPGVHGEQTDLRAKLTGGIKKPGAIKKPGERDIRKPGYDTTKPRGPAACPW